ncbi:MAG TPA: prephenate dehydratase [Verrucomicrobiae bacterium]|nr:prephenate dehydratase [Verrucomicrobiae bacterium]
MKVAIQGELGSFSHEAAEKMVTGCTVVPCARSAEVFERLERGAVQAAVIPIENTLAGTVAEHADLLVDRPVFVQGEYFLRIVHNVIAARGVKLSGVRRVLSHPVALDQCRNFFRLHPHVEPVPFYDTAGSVKHIVGGHLRDTAAIAGRKAAQQYSAKILQSGVEDNKENFTRFFLIRGLKDKSRNYQGLYAKTSNKTSIAFHVKNVPGVLFRSLSVFALRDISLSKIESRPMRGRPWEYVFYVDFLRGDDEAARNALHHLSEVAEFVKVLGIYRAARAIH